MMPDPQPAADSATPVHTGQAPQSAPSNEIPVDPTERPAASTDRTDTPDPLSDTQMLLAMNSGPDIRFKLDPVEVALRGIASDANQMKRFGGDLRVARVLLSFAFHFVTAEDAPKEKVQREKQSAIEVRIVRRANQYVKQLGERWQGLPGLLNIGPDGKDTLPGVLFELSQHQETRAQKLNAKESGPQPHPDRFWEMHHEVLLIAGTFCKMAADRPGVLLPFFNFARHVYNVLPQEKQPYWIKHVNIVLGGILNRPHFNNALVRGAFGSDEARDAVAGFGDEVDRLAPVTEALMKDVTARSADHLKYLSCNLLNTLVNVVDGDVIGSLTQPLRWASIIATREFSAELRMRLALHRALERDDADQGNETFLKDEDLKDRLLDSIALTLVVVDPVFHDELPTGKPLNDQIRLDTAKMILRREDLPSVDSTHSYVLSAARRLLENHDRTPDSNLYSRSVLAMRAAAQLPRLYANEAELLDTVQLLAADGALSNRGLLAVGRFLRFFNLPTERQRQNGRIIAGVSPSRRMDSERFFVLQTRQELLELIRTQIAPFLHTRIRQEERSLAIATELMEVARISGIRAVRRSPAVAFEAARSFMNDLGDQPLPMLFLGHLACQRGKTINRVLTNALRNIVNGQSDIRDAFYLYSALKEGPNQIDVSQRGLIESLRVWKIQRSEQWRRERSASAQVISSARKDVAEAKPHSSGIQALPEDRLSGLSEIQRFLGGSSAYQLSNYSPHDRELRLHYKVSVEEYLKWVESERMQAMSGIDDPRMFSADLFTMNPLAIEIRLHLLGVAHPENPEDNTFDIVNHIEEDKRRRHVPKVGQAHTPRAIRESTRYILGIGASPPKRTTAQKTDELAISLDGFTSCQPLGVPRARRVDNSLVSAELPMAIFQLAVTELERTIKTSRYITKRGLLQQAKLLAETTQPRAEATIDWRTMVRKATSSTDLAIDLLQVEEKLSLEVRRALRLGIAALVPDESLPEGFDLLRDPSTPIVDRAVVIIEFLREARNLLAQRLTERGMPEKASDLWNQFQSLFEVSMLRQMQKLMQPRTEDGSDSGLEAFFTAGPLLDYMGHVSETCATRRFSVRADRPNMVLMPYVDRSASLDTPVIRGGVGVIGVVGYEDGNQKRCLLIRSFNPRAALLQSVPVDALYSASIRRIAQLGVANRFDYVISPHDIRAGMMLSNRRDIVQVQRDRIPEPRLITLSTLKAFQFNGYPRLAPGTTEWNCAILGRCDELARTP